MKGYTAKCDMLCTPIEQPCFCVNGGYFDAVNGSCVCLQDYTGAHCENYNATGDYWSALCKCLHLLHP